MAPRDASPKYAPLVTFLMDLPSATAAVIVTLAEIEGLIGSALPAGAWVRGWWQVVQDQGRQRPWARAGWQVSQVSMRVVPPSVTVARMAADANTEPRAVLQ
jgi:hypothetical protein